MQQYRKIKDSTVYNIQKLDFSKDELLIMLYVIGDVIGKYHLDGLEDDTIQSIDIWNLYNAGKKLLSLLKGE